MKALNYIYYRLYLILTKTNANDIAEYVASFWLIILVCTNLIVLIKLVGIHPLNYVSTFRLLALILFIPMFVLMYFLYIRKKRYKILVEMYAKETKVERIRGYIILIGYVIISFIALIVF
jgi:hypothetical protein